MKGAYTMKLEVITEGLKSLLLENNYNPATIHFYEREWKKISTFFEQEYNDTEFDMERGIKYLEHQNKIKQKPKKIQKSNFLLRNNL